MALEKSTLVAVSARRDSNIILVNADGEYQDFSTDLNHIKYVTVLYQVYAYSKIISLNLLLSCVVYYQQSRKRRATLA